MPVVLRRTIDAPPELVFSIYTDPARLPAWQPGLRGLLEQTGPLEEPGTTYTLDQPGPRLRITVLHVERPRLHQQLEEFQSYGWIGTARFDPLPDGRTKLTYQVETRGQPRWLWSAVVAVSSWTYGRAELNRLKEVCERAAAGVDVAG